VTILEIEGLIKDFRGLRALNSVNASISQGEIFGLIGPNGSGKSTLINVISGFLKPTEGKITYKGQSIEGLEPHQIAKKGIVRTFQLTSIFPDLTVEQNVICGNHLLVKSSTVNAFFWTKGYKNDEINQKKLAREILTLLKIQDKSNSVARNLPAADRRILEIAIALAAKPQLLFLDEPASGMNMQEAMRIVDLIRLLQKEGLTIVIVEHNMKVIMEVCSRIMVLNYGSKIAEGLPDSIANNQEVISIYLGGKK
jgi:branched-chain amino acid transport system ATP-binding protein